MKSRLIFLASHKRLCCVVDPAPGPAEQAELLDTVARVESALNEDARQAFRLFHEHGRTIDQIAEFLCISPRNVDRLLAKVRRRITDTVKKRG